MRRVLVREALLLLPAVYGSALLGQSPIMTVVATNGTAGAKVSSDGAFPAPRTSTTVRVSAESSDSPVPAAKVTQSQVLSSAGTYGDFSRYLQLLPGVIGSSDLTNDVLVRGGHPVENLFTVDGIEFPGISHFSLSGSNGGFTSMIDSTAVSSMDLINGAYNASYSSRLSSLVEIHTRQPGEEQQAGNLTAGISGAGGLFQRKIGRTGYYLLSAHRSVLNLVTNDIGINGVPTYTNGLFRLQIEPGDRDRVSLLSVSGNDAIHMTPCSGNTAVSSLFRTDYSGWRTTNGVSWGHTFNPRVTTSLTASYSITAQQIGQQQQVGSLIVNGNLSCQPEELIPIYRENSRNELSQLNYTVRRNFHEWLVTLGADGKLATPDDSVAQPIGQLSPFSASTTYSDAVTFHRRFSTGQTAGFVEVEGQPGKRWGLMAGVRAESFAITGSYAIDPRIAISFRLNSRQSLHGFWNIASQLPPMMDLLSYPTNRNLVPIQVRQESVGIRLWQGNWGTIDAEAYDKKYRHEPVSTEFPQLMLFNMVDTLGQQFVWLPLTSHGSAESRGLEAVLRGHWHSRLELLVSAARAQSTYRALDGIRRPGNYNTPLTFNSMGNLRLPFGFKIDVRESFASGRLYTPFDMADSIKQSRGIYDLSRINALRSRYYNRVDLEVERRFRVKNGAIELHAGAENIFNRGNLLCYVWLDNCTAGTPCMTEFGSPVEKVDQMGRYPIFNLRYEF